MKKYLYILLAVFTIISCKNEVKKQNGKLQIVTTTTMITDMVATIGGTKVDVKGLMGSGVDPHLYKASEGDVTKLFNADVIIYNGLHLEGKLEDIFEKMRKQQKKTIAVSDAIDKSGLIRSEYFASSYDPHIWFHIDYWKQATRFVIDELKKLDPKNAEYFEEKGQKYIERLTTLAKEVSEEIQVLPVEKRILVTAHDAFNYFGKLHNFEVVGLQGLSTATEAGVQDVQKLASFIIEKDIKAIFVESSVPKRTIEALQAAVQSKDHEVAIGGTLYSDALGDAGTEEGTYIGMYKYNVSTIVNALK
ncbi:zinc ABC transporter substrate-binding protein [Kordia algicida OT-1]|uniref:Zinc ABC transporter, periplasmic zinc-binding protein n=1 Tax=Kordia algicida OT-1 TaxID=391587 RepID=A9DN92_9FLAO|nr:zinc ABC transporter substrate-binding protein [Kordia algicida]EDP97139.1 zinc ABC transporter, periplasmic zinc-binding protein [Kordia algicida OT-1]